MLKLDNTRIQTYKTCPRLFYWKYIQNYRYKVITPSFIALNLGKLMHAALKDFYEAKSIEEVKPTNFDKEVIEYNKKFISSNVDLGNKEDDSSNDVLIMARVYRQAYYDFYKSDLEMFKTIDVEKFLEYKLPNIDGIFYGTLDLITSDKSSPHILLEHKTTSQITASYLEKLILDTQITSYFFLMHRALGILPDRIIYNVIRKSRIKRKSFETDEEFGNRLYTNIQADVASFFYREDLVRDHIDLDDFEQQLVHIYEDIINKMKANKNAWYQNTQSCSFYGSCEMLKMCSLDETNASIYYDKVEGNKLYE